MCAPARGVAEAAVIPGGRAGPDCSRGGRRSKPGRREQQRRFIKKPAVGGVETRSPDEGRRGLSLGRGWSREAAGGGGRRRTTSEQWAWGRFTRDLSSPGSR